MKESSVIDDVSAGARQARQRDLRNGGRSREGHSNEHNEFRGDEVGGQANAMQHSWVSLGPYDQTTVLTSGEHGFGFIAAAVGTEKR